MMIQVETPWLGGIIHDLRLAQQPPLGLRELARRANIDPSSLSKLEKGQRKTIALDGLVRVARELNTTLDELYDRAGLVERERAADVEDAIRGSLQLTDQEKQTLIAVHQTFLERR